MTRPALVAIFVLGILMPAIGHGLTVSGTITDSASTPIAGIKVEIWNEDTLLDELIEVVYTDAAGFYTSTEPLFAINAYVIVHWEFQLVPSDFFNDRVVRILDKGAGRPFVPVLTYNGRRSLTVPTVITDVTIDVGMSQPQEPGLNTLVARVQQTLDYVRNNRGTVAWDPDYDVPVHIITDNFARASFEVYIPTISFDGTGSSFWIVAVYHELAHKLHRHHDASFPPRESGCGVHTINSEEDPGCALIEGYASYIGQLVAETEGVMSGFFRSYRDDGVGGGGFPANSLWRGDEGDSSSSPMYTGLDGMAFESGEIIEGAVSGFMFGVHDALGFATNFAVMNDDGPDHVFDLRGGLVTDAGGAGTAQTLQIHEIMQTHGILFNRLRFRLDPFDEPEPPDTAQHSYGNKKEINGYTFLRGTVTAFIEPVSLADLGAGRGFPNNSYRVGFKPASAGLTDLPSEFMNFTPMNLFTTIDLDTTTFGGASGDGDWDLLMVSKNADDFIDNMFPTWLGDGNPAVATDERYLKTVGTWYDDDRDPGNDPKAGMVLIDNTAPVVENFKPQ